MRFMQSLRFKQRISPFLFLTKKVKILVFSYLQIQQYMCIFIRFRILNTLFIFININMNK